MAIWVRAASFGAQFTVKHWQPVPPAKAAADVPSKASTLFTLFFPSSSPSSSGSLRQGTGIVRHIISTAPPHVNAPQCVWGFFSLQNRTVYDGGSEDENLAWKKSCVHVRSGSAEYGPERRRDHLLWVKLACMSPSTLSPPRRLGACGSGCTNVLCKSATSASPSAQEELWKESCLWFLFLF